MPGRAGSPISTARIPGMGLKSQAVLHAVGVFTFEQLQASDVVDLHARLKPVAPGLSINFLYGLFAPQSGVHWQRVQCERRIEILLRPNDMGLAP